jgi:hypothetical protein
MNLKLRFCYNGLLVKPGHFYNLTAAMLLSLKQSYGRSPELLFAAFNTYNRKGNLFFGVYGLSSACLTNHGSTVI